MKKVLRTKDIAQALSVSKPTACKLLHAGKIPKIQLSIKCIGAFESDVEAYLLNRDSHKSQVGATFYREKEIQLLKLYYGDGLSYKDIGIKLGRSTRSIANAIYRYVNNA